MTSFLSSPLFTFPLKKDIDSFWSLNVMSFIISYHSVVVAVVVVVVKTVNSTDGQELRRKISHEKK